RAWSAAACASDCARDCSATAMARPCSASSIAWRRAISLSSTSLLGDAVALDGALGGQPSPLDRLAGVDLRALGLQLLGRLLARHVGPLPGPLDLQLALLGQPGVLELAI